MRRALAGISILIAALLLPADSARSEVIRVSASTWRKAVESAKGGDTLILLTGRYAGPVRLPTGVALDGGGSILEVGPDTAGVRDAGTLGTGGADPDAALTLEGNNVIQNLFVHGGGGTDVGVRVLHGPVRFERVHVRGFRRYGIRAGGGEGTFLEGSVQDCGEDGISAAGGRWTIRSSRFSKNGDDGVDLFRSNSSMILSCVFDENADAAVELAISQDVRLIGNASRGHRVTCAARLGDLPSRFSNNRIADRAFLERRGESPVTAWAELVGRTDNTNIHLAEESSETLTAVPVEINVVVQSAASSPAAGAPRPTYTDGMGFYEQVKQSVTRNLSYAGLQFGDVAMKNSLGADTLITPLLRRALEDPTSVGSWLAERGRDGDSGLPARYRQYMADLGMYLGSPADTHSFNSENPKSFGESVVSAWKILDVEFQKSFSSFDAAGLDKLRRDLEAQYAEEPQLGMPLVEDYEFDVALDLELRRLLITAGQVDTAALFGSGARLLFFLEDVSSALVVLKGNLTAKQLSQPVMYRQKTPWGMLVIAGTGDDRHETVSGILFDLGGNDRYVLDADSPAILIVDLSGDDEYRGNVASGVGRLAGLWDGGGNDRYESGSRAQGGGLLGVGILHDVSGRDEYSASRYSQGFGFFGVGWLHDGGGDDVYRVPGYGQGFGGVRGLGVLSDASGNDRYEILPVNNDPIRDPSRTTSMGQGIGDGLRPQGAGGIGILWDGGGRDEYLADLFAQGIGYWYGFGALIDVGGANDNYTAYHYVQGAGVHLSVGALYDDGGNDRYSAWYVSQGCGHDASVGALFDVGGNDIYAAYGLSQGAGSTNGVGIIADGGGRDAYMGVARMSGQGDAWYQARLREYGSIGLMIDLGGGSDYYASGSLNGCVWFKGDHGLGVDE